jgi:hypothetical protein
MVTLPCLDDSEPGPGRFDFGGGSNVYIWCSGVDLDELSETQNKRLENLTTKYVGHLAEILLSVN